MTGKCERHAKALRHAPSPVLQSAQKNIGVILDSNLSMKKHVIKICPTAYFELKGISSIGRFLIEDAAKTLVTSYTQFCHPTFPTISKLCCKTFPWHSATTTQQPSWKNCTGFPFQKILNIKLLIYVSTL